MTAHVHQSFSQTRSQIRTITLWGRLGSVAASRLRPGRDLVLDISSADASTLARGVAIEDHLSSATRIQVDSLSRELYRAWRSRHASALTIEGVELAHVWEVELLAQCFLPAARLLQGLPRALSVDGAGRLTTRLLDQGVRRLAAAIVEPLGIEVGEAKGDVLEHLPVRRKASSRLGSAAVTLGVPPRVRGEIVTLAYWHMAPVFREFARRRGGPQLVASPLPVRNVSAHDALSLAARGGWTGMPGPVARGSSRATLTAALQAARDVQAEDPVQAAVDCHALETLERISLETLAHVRHARRALAGKRVRLGVLPFDSPEQARMLLPPLEGAGARTLLLQHGFPGRLGDPDMRLADHRALWSGHDRSLVPELDPSTSTITGNPAVEHLAELSPRRRERLGRSIVLVDYPGRLSVRVEGRISVKHITAALRGLAKARPGSHVIVRPHPGDLAPHAYERLASGYPELRVEVDAHSPIEPLLESADLCVGSLSTATLQACVLGVPTVFLDVSGITRHWPFDGSGLPLAYDSESLMVAVATALSATEVEGREVAMEALGVRGGATQRVVDLILELSR